MKLQGLYTAIVTPFAGNRVDEEAFRMLVEAQIAAGVAGIVSQNISLFCSGTGLATYPRASMNKDALAKALKLTSPQTPRCV